MNRVWLPAVFQPLPHAGGETSEADTHVESFEDVLSDAGSTPAASTNFSREFEDLASFSRRLHYFSTRKTAIRGPRLENSHFGNEVIHCDRAVSIVSIP
jgi:hypothetical protein